jgi:hypothetical protein
MTAGFQPADQHVQINERLYTLRLTLGALAEISQLLKAAGPRGLSAQMKALTPEASCVMLRALLRPCHSRDMPYIRKGDLTAELLRAMALIFEHSFYGLSGGSAHE